MSGSNKMDGAYFFYMIFYAGTLILFGSFSYWKNDIFLMCSIFGIILILILVKYLFTFRISLTKNKIIISKRFLQIPYLNINLNFEKIYFQNTSSLIFENGNGLLEIERHQGFEIDCLLIVKNNSSYEIGDLEDANKILIHLKSGIDFLKLYEN